MPKDYVQYVKLISPFAGQKQTVTIPGPFLRITGSYEKAVFLNEMIFWANRGKAPGGWIWRTYAEWAERVYLNEYQVRKAAKWLVGEGVLETKIKKAQGSPTVHYRLVEPQFSEWIVKKLSMDTAISQEPTCEIEGSLTVDHTVEDTVEDGGASSAPEGAKKSAQEIQTKIEDETEVHTHDGLIQKFAGDGNLNLTRLGHFWRLTVILNHPKVGAMPVLTVKEKSQLKNTVAKMSEPVVQKLGLVVRDWHLYCAHCESEHGAFNTPGSPNIPFVTKFAKGIESYWVKVHGTGITPLKGNGPVVTVTNPE